jgi:hypothetical protein
LAGKSWFGTRAFVAIAQDASRRELALGRRFISFLVLPENSPLVGQIIEAANVPIPHWSPCAEIHEFDR